MNDSFLEKVRSTINKYSMFEKSERLLVCLSGGADSVSLLLCLKDLGYDVCACHVNHQLRGDESDRDQRFCEDLCSELGVELFTQRIDVKAYCKQNSLSIEEGARKLRYDVFRSVSADKICTAHTLSDCLETTIFNLARGTGLKGLCSIPPVRDNIVRPLINCTRDEIVGFLNAKGQKFVVDSTNLSDEYTRNKIRHNVIPVLESINPSLFKSYENTIGFLRSDEQYLAKTAENLYPSVCVNNKIKLSGLLELAPPVRDRVVVRWLEDNGLKISKDNISFIVAAAQNTGKYNISGDICAVCSKGWMMLDQMGKSLPENDLTVKITSMGDYSYFNRTIHFELLDISNADVDIANFHKKFTNCCMDYDKIKGGIVIHTRRPGDSIRLVNRQFSSSVRKLLNSSFDISSRKSAVVMYDNEGAVFVEKSGAADRVKITEHTKKVVVFSIKDII